MTNYKFKKIVHEASKAVKEYLGDHFIDEIYEEIVLDVLARVYDVCEDRILPEPENLPVIME